MSGSPLLPMINLLRRVLRSLTTSKAQVGAIEKCLRGGLMTPVFALMLGLLRLRALVRGPLRAPGLTVDGHEIMCDLPDLISLYVFTFGVWEPDITAFIRSRLKPGDGFVDIGANIGYDTLLAAGVVGPRGFVPAIEASPAVFQRLHESWCGNGTPPQVRLIHGAASDVAGTLNLYAGPPTNVGLATTVRRAGMPKVAEVPARPIGELLTHEEMSQTRLVKIDVEGGEIAVLRGVLSCIERMPHHVEIAVELSPLWWDDRTITTADVLRPWVERGFNVYTIHNNYWPWRYVWPNAVSRPRRVREPTTMTRRVKRLDVVLSRVDADVL